MKKEDIYKIGNPAKKAYKPFIELVMKYAGKNDKILDVGGGEGAYSEELIKRGYCSVCVDINDEYIKTSKKRGVESYAMDATSLDFPDNSFDIVLLFEVIEHIEDFIKVLNEAKRVSRRLILITVPNCTGINELLFLNLTYDHLLARDHVHFFTKKDLENILSTEFESFKVEEADPLILGALGMPFWLKYPILWLYRFKIIKSNVYHRLYGIIELE